MDPPAMAIIKLINTYRALHGGWPWMGKQRRQTIEKVQKLTAGGITGAIKCTP